VEEQAAKLAPSRLTVMGTFVLEVAQIAAPALATQKARALLTYLVTHSESDVGRERLLEILWPEIDPDRAKEGLRSALWSIRRAIRDAGLEPDEYLTANRAVVRWKAQTWLDAEQFQRLAQSDDPHKLETALALYKGDFLEGDYEEWTVAERARLGTVYESVLARLVRSARNHEAAQLLLTRNPYDEPSYLLLIEAELAAGRVVAAAALGERCERALAEVGAQPSAAVRQLVGGISSRQVQSVPKLVLPFVGREAELAKVRDRLVAETAGGYAVLVSGEPGIGKSAFLSHAADIARSLDRSIVNVRCFETDSRPFGPFEELYADLYDEPLNPLASDHLDAARRLADSLVNGLGSLAVLSIDDAHTLRAEARRVLSAVAGQLGGRGLTLFVASRTEGLPDILATLSGCPAESIVLGPLGLDDLRVAIDSVVADDQEVLATTVFERSGGHPLFAATLLDSLAQSGLLRADHGTWRLVGTLDDQVALPKTLTTYIQARLRARGETASAVAAALAIEPAATAEDIIAALQLPEGQVFDALDDLLALGVVIQPPSGPQLTFAHDLYREVAGAILNPGRRARLHRSFAERFGSSPSAESSLRCARHLAFAGDAMGAAQAYYRAAIEALEWGAWREARDRCSAGIIGLERLERQPEIEALLARLKMLSSKAHAALGDLPAAIASASDAITIAKRSGESRTAIEAALSRQHTLIDDYDVVATLASSREIAAMAREMSDGAALAVALAGESWAQRLLGHETESIQAARDAESAAESTGDGDFGCYALEQLILAHVTWWRFAEALEAATRAPQVVARASRLARAAVQCAIAALDLSLERYKEASSDIATATALLQQDVDEPRRGLAHTPFGPARLKLALAAIAARIALEEDDIELAATLADELETMRSTRAHELAQLFRADVFLRLGTADKTQNDRSGSLALPSSLFVQDVHSGSRSPALTGALLAALLESNDAQAMIARALDVVEASARRAPLEADSAFGEIARAAKSCGASQVALRAELRRDDYREMRAAASSRVLTPLRAESKSR
jgi:DNA-binding SARP family transcriptional activator